jgi:CRP-like cAMP-binding protein
MMDRGTLPVPAEADAEPDAADLVAEWEEETPSHRPETQNFTRATAIANAAMASPLLLSLRSDALIELSHHAELLGARAGGDIYAEGDVADAVYFVIDGEVTLSMSDSTIRREAGELFGAESILFDGKRVFAAQKSERAKVLSLDLADVRALIATDFHARQAFSIAAVSEVATAFVHAHGFAAEVGGQAAAEFVARARLVEVVVGDVIIEQGERPHGLVYVADGEAQLGDGQHTYRPGDPIGANWVLAGQGATAPVRATKDCWLLAIDRASAAAMVAAHPLLLEKLSQ